jgi:hypothetical protein
MANIDKIRNISNEELLEILNKNHSLSATLKSMGITYRNEIIISLLKERISKLEIDIYEFWRKSYKDIQKRDIEDAVKNSFSISKTLERLGLAKYNSGNYQRFKVWTNLYNLDTSHFIKGGKRSRGIFKLSLDDLLVENSPCQSRASLKKRLIDSGLLENKCYECGLTEWRGKSLTIQLEHINGNSIDNRLKNLTMLCPNCHSQTSTYAGRGLKIKREDKFCKCGKKISNNVSQCKECYGKTMSGRIVLKTRKVKDRPSQDQIRREVEETSYVAVGKKYGVSDNAIRKWLK